MPTTLIKGGRVIDPASNTDAILDVLIREGSIASIAPSLSPTDTDETIDASGLIVSPGLIDPHVHLREPGHTERESIRTGTLAAVRGGFTSVCCMPNTEPTLDSPEMVNLVAARAEKSAACRVFTVAAATKGRRGAEPTEFGLLARAGTVGFSDDGDAVADAGVMQKVLSAVAPTGLVFMQHCQEPSLTEGSSMHAGEISTRLGLIGWPRVAEEIIAERDIRLARAAGCRYHIQHISSAGTVEILRHARSDSLCRSLITGEASPHHLILTDEACDNYNTNAKMNPPLRESADREALRLGVADGTITILATDHAPHTPRSKSTDFASASFGIIGLETALPLYIEALIDPGHIDWPRLIALLTQNPAALCTLDRKGLGTLREDGPADITLIDPDSDWTIRAEDSVSKARNTPFDRRRVRGRAVRTIVAGQTAWSIEAAKSSP